MFRSLLLSAGIAGLLASPIHAQQAEVLNLHKLQVGTVSLPEGVYLPATFADMMNDACPLPELPVDARVIDPTVRSMNHLITKETHAPAVIVEQWHIGSDALVSHFDVPCNHWNLMKSVVQGIDEYRVRVQPNLRTVIISDGHGPSHQGNPGGFNGVPEYVYTGRAVRYLEELLPRSGYEVVKLIHEDFRPGNYAPRREHIRRVARAANAVADDRPIYVEMHTNSLGPKFAQVPLPTWVYVNPSSSRNARVLADAIAGTTTGYFCLYFPDSCASASGFSGRVAR